MKSFIEFKYPTFLYNWENLEKIPVSFLSGIEQLFAKEPEIIHPSTTWKSKGERTQLFIQWIQRISHERFWIFFYHGENKEYFQYILDQDIPKKPFHRWKVNDIIYLIYVEKSIIQELIAFLEKTDGLFQGLRTFQSTTDEIPRKDIFFLTLITHWEQKTAWVNYLRAHGIPVYPYPQTYANYMRVNDTWSRFSRNVSHQLSWCYISYLSILYKHLVPLQFDVFCIIHQNACIVKGGKKKVTDALDSFLLSNHPIKILGYDDAGYWNAVLIHKKYLKDLNERYFSSFTLPKCQDIIQDITTTELFFTSHSSDLKNTVFGIYETLFFKKHLHEDFHTFHDNDNRLMVTPFSLYGQEMKDSTISAPKSKNIYLIHTDQLYAYRWWKYFNYPSEYTIFRVLDVSSHVFPEFPKWQLIRNHPKAFRILGFLLIFYNGGLISFQNTLPECFHIGDCESGSFLLRLLRHPLKSYDDIYLNILQGKKGCTIVYYFLRFFFQICDTDRLDQHLHDRFVLSTFVHVLLANRAILEPELEFQVCEPTIPQPIYNKIYRTKYFHIYQNEISPISRFPYIYPIGLDTLRELDIAILMQNNEDYLEVFFWNMLRKLKRRFLHIHIRIFIYENNSSDGTVQSIENHKKEFTIFLFQQNLKQFTQYERIDRLGKIRNIFMKQILQIYSQEDRNHIPKKPFLLFMDTDVIFPIDSIVHLITAMNQKTDAVMMGANVLAYDHIYYDMLALNHGTFYVNNNREELSRFFQSSNTPSSPALISCSSFFGGMTLVYKDLLFFTEFGKDGTLHGVDKKIRCEHYYFCDLMRKWGNLYVYTLSEGYWVANWKQEWHRVAPQLSRYLSSH